MTRRDQILAYVRDFPRQDDDEIARAIQAPQRQLVNVICRDLEARGLIVRKIGRFGKIANFPSTAATHSPRLVAEPDHEGDAVAVGPAQSSLTVDRLEAGGFLYAGGWALAGDTLTLSQPAAREAGVYAFTQGGTALYVGVANMGLSKRFYTYARPGRTQTTSIRLNAAIRAALQAGEAIDIYVACPQASEWNGLPVNMAAGLELGLIGNFSLPWNKRNSRS